MATNQPGYEIPAEMRDLAEKSVEQARKAIDGVRRGVVSADRLS